MNRAERVRADPGPARPRWAWVFASIGALLVALLALPLAVLIWTALSNELLTFLRDPSLQRAISLSILTSSISVGVLLLLGTPLAYVLARWSFRGKVWVELIIDLPLVLPPLIAGIALLLAFGRNGILGRPLDLVGLRLPFTTAAVVVAQVFVAGPLYVRTARLGFAAVAPELREAAAVEGANEVQLFRYVMVPLARRALGSGLILAWARAFGEFGATIVFAGNMEGRTQTIPLAIFVGFETNLGVALGLSLVLLVIAALVLLLLRWIGRGVPTA
ncbi:MAG: molybdate ABC transporter permease subunit [Chloroflexi bacterium]|nr:molybdate ABC transporter permease subunit [Chloroflexota bacterium]